MNTSNPTSAAQAEASSADTDAEPHQRPFTVALLDDDPACVQRFEHAITQHPDMRWLGAWGTISQTLEALRLEAPDVLLCDLHLPDGSGLEVLAFCAAHHPHTRVLVVTVLETEEYVLRSIEMGACGYVLKDSVPEQIITPILEVAQGGSPITPTVARYLLKKLNRTQESPHTAPNARSSDSSHTQSEDQALSTPLTQQERDILERMSQGSFAQELALQFNVDESTMQSHLQSIYQKFEIRSNAQALNEAKILQVLRKT